MPKETTTTHSKLKLKKVLKMIVAIASVVLFVVVGSVGYIALNPKKVIDKGLSYIAPKLAPSIKYQKFKFLPPSVLRIYDVELQGYGEYEGAKIELDSLELEAIPFRPMELLKAKISLAGVELFKPQIYVDKNKPAGQLLVLDSLKSLWQRTDAKTQSQIRPVFQSDLRWEGLSLWVDSTQWLLSPKGQLNYDGSEFYELNGALEVHNSKLDLVSNSIQVKWGAPQNKLPALKWVKVDSLGVELITKHNQPINKISKLSLKKHESQDALKVIELLLGGGKKLLKNTLVELDEFSFKMQDFKAQSKQLSSLLKWEGDKLSLTSSGSYAFFLSKLSKRPIRQKTWKWKSDLSFEFRKSDSLNLFLTGLKASGDSTWLEGKDSLGVHKGFAFGWQVMDSTHYHLPIDFENLSFRRAWVFNNWPKWVSESNLRLELSELLLGLNTKVGIENIYSKNIQLNRGRLEVDTLFFNKLSSHDNISLEMGKAKAKWKLEGVDSLSPYIYTQRLEVEVTSLKFDESVNKESKPIVKPDRKTNKVSDQLPFVFPTELSLNIKKAQLRMKDSGVFKLKDFRFQTNGAMLNFSKNKGFLQLPLRHVFKEKQGVDKDLNLIFSLSELEYKIPNWIYKAEAKRDTASIWKQRPLYQSLENGRWKSIHFAAKQSEKKLDWKVDVKKAWLGQVWAMAGYSNKINQSRSVFYENWNSIVFRLPKKWETSARVTNFHLDSITERYVNWGDRIKPEIKGELKLSAKIKIASKSIFKPWKWTGKAQLKGRDLKLANLAIQDNDFLRERAPVYTKAMHFDTLDVSGVTFSSKGVHWKHMMSRGDVLDFKAWGNSDYQGHFYFDMSAEIPKKVASALPFLTRRGLEESKKGGRKVHLALYGDSKEQHFKGRDQMITDAVVNNLKSWLPW